MTEPARCHRCTAVRAPDDAAAILTWSSERDKNGIRWLCPACIRANVRDIEAKLPERWW